MPQVHVNFLAVLVAAIINMIVGSIWYSPAVFGRRWMALVGKRMEDMRGGGGRAYAGIFVAALILAYVMARVVGLAHAQTVGQGAGVGFWMWIGFVATATAGDFIFAGRPPGLYILNNGYQLIALIIIGAVLAVWP